MERISALTAKHLRRVVELADRLAAKDIVIELLMVQWGCWDLRVQKGEEADRYLQTRREGRIRYDLLRGPDEVRFFWDGRDQILTIEVSPVRGDSAAHEWKKEDVKHFAEEGDELFRFVEDYLSRRFSV